MQRFPQDGQTNQNILAAMDPEMRRAWINQQMARQPLDGMGQTPHMNVNTMMDLLRNNPHLQQSQQPQQSHQPHQQSQQPTMQQSHPAMQQMNPLAHQSNGAMNMSQQNPLQNHPTGSQNNPLTQQQIEQFLRANPSANPTQFLQAQQQQFTRRMAISHENSGIDRQFHLLNEGAGIRPPQNRGPMLGHQQPGQPQQQRQPMMTPQVGGMPGQSPAMGMVGGIPQQQQHPFNNSPNLTVNPPQRGHSPLKFGPTQQMSQQSMQPQPQITHEQCLQTIKQLQDDIRQSEVDIGMLSRTRPAEPDQLPILHNNLTKKRQTLLMFQSIKDNFERNGGQLQRQNGGPSPNPNQSGQMPWPGSNPNPTFTGMPTPVNNAEIQQQLARMQQGQQPMTRQSQGMPMMMPNQQQQQQPQQPPQQFSYLQQAGPHPTPQQQPTDPNSAQHPPGFGNQASAFFRSQQQQQQSAPPSQNPAQSTENQWMHPGTQQQLSQIRNHGTSSELVSRLTQGGRPVPPLDRAKFDSTLELFFKRSNRTVAQSELQQVHLEGRVFSLWDLHREVMNHGTIVNVTDRNLWPIIGANLGFSIVPGQPGPRASDRIGDILREIHKQYLLQFENTYIRAFTGSGAIAGGNNGSITAPAAGNNGAGPRPGMPPQAGQRLGFSSSSTPEVVNPSGPIPAQQGAEAQQSQMMPPMQLTSQLRALAQSAPYGIQHLLQYANTPADQMRERGVPENFIATVERFRPLLARQVMLLSEQQKNNAQANAARQAGAQPTPGNGMQQQQQNPQMMPPQGPGVSNGQRPPDFPPGPAGRPGSIGIQRPDAPGMMVLPNTNLQLPPGPPMQQQPPKQDIQDTERAIRALQATLNKSEQTPPVAIPDAELVEWRKEFEIASKMVIDLEKHLTFFYIMFRDSQTLKKLMAYITVVKRQQHALRTGGPPTYFILLQNIRAVNQLFQQASLRIKEAFARLQRLPKDNSQPGQPGPLGPPGPHPPQQMPEQGPPPQPVMRPPQPVQQPQPGHAPAHMPLHQQLQPPQQFTGMPAPELPRAPSAAARVPTPQGPSISKHGRAASNSMPKPNGPANTPSPAAAPTPAAATPVASASSPPKTPKSPGKKAAPKPKPPRKKPAPVAPAPPPAPSAPVSTPAPSHTSAPAPSPAPSPQAAPTPSQSGTKRPRPDDPPDDLKPLQTAQTAPTPPQKRVKLEPEPEMPLPPVEEPLPPTPPKEEEEEKSAQQVIEEFQNMIANGGDVLPFDFQQACNAIAEQFSYGGGDLPPTNFGSLSIPPLEPQPVGADVFEFIDFTQSEDDGLVNANTPDLMPPSGSGSNCSPESVPDNDAAALAARSSIFEKQKATQSSTMGETSKEEVKSEPPVDSMLAILSELDVSFLQNDAWSWDKPMSPADWAISTS